MSVRSFAAPSRQTRPARMRSRPAWGRVALSAALLNVALPVAAGEIPLGDPDYKLRWDNTVRYNAAMRLLHADAFIERAGGYSYDQSDAKFGKGDLTTDRIDILSELDFSYQKRYGARVSAAGWYDAAYGSHAAHTANPSAYVDDEYTSIVKRYYGGPSAEVLDAYVYGRAELGEVPVDVRAGKHVVLFGEGLFGSTNSVAYSQEPSDSRKLTANPGASAKETALPVGQISAVAQVSDQLVLAGQYTVQWEPNRIPEGGTYYAGADTILDGPNVGRESALKGGGGDVGLSARWRPDWFDGTWGFYYRRFDEKSPWTSQLDSATGLRRAVYARDVDLFGLSLASNVGGVAVGAELSLREHMPLNSRGAAAGTLEGARGNTLHGLVNGIQTFGTSPVWSSASLSGELAWSHLVKVTDNAALFRGDGNAATGCATIDIIGGCSTRDFVSAAVSFSPAWTQALPSVDLSMPLFYSINLHGNAPTNAGGSVGFQTIKAGISALAYSRHQVDLAVTWYHGRFDESRGLILGAPYNDKATLSLTYQATF